MRRNAVRVLAVRGNAQKRCVGWYGYGLIRGSKMELGVRIPARWHGVEVVFVGSGPGRVELVAEGLKDELEAFQQGIRESGLGGFISNEETKWEDPKGEFRGFGISG